MKDLGSNLSSNFRMVVLALMMTPDEYDAKLLNKAIQVSAVRLNNCFGTKQLDRTIIPGG